jgi:AcrR family transcriptional regulator
MNTTAVHATKSTEHGQATREQLLEAALRLFAERGFKGATVREIAREAGVSQGLIRFHFGSKEGLRHALDDRVVTWVFELLDDLPDVSGEGIFDAIGARWTQRVGSSEAVRLFQKYIIRALQDEGEAGRRLHTAVVQFYRQVISRVQAFGRIRDGIDDDWAAMMVASLVLGTFLLAPTFEQEFGLRFTDKEVHQKRIQVISKFLEHGLLAGNRSDSRKGT